VHVAQILTFNVGIMSKELNLNGIGLRSRGGGLAALGTAGARGASLLLVHGQHPGRGVLHDALRVSHKHLRGLVGTGGAPGALLVGQQELLLVGRVDSSTGRRRRLRPLLRTGHGDLLADNTLMIFVNFCFSYYTKIGELIFVDRK
jgi:hypothetical protein